MCPVKQHVCIQQKAWKGSFLCRGSVFCYIWYSLRIFVSFNDTWTRHVTDLWCRSILYFAPPLVATCGITRREPTKEHRNWMKLTFIKTCKDGLHVGLLCILIPGLYLKRQTDNLTAVNISQLLLFDRSAPISHVLLVTLQHIFRKQHIRNCKAAVAQEKKVLSLQLSTQVSRNQILFT